MMNDINNLDILSYIEYLEANGLTLDENGNEIKKDEKTLSLSYGNKNE